jgi:quercetin dioxygenase-like cupin family protein
LRTFRQQSERQNFAWLGGTIHSIALSGDDTEGRLTLLRSAMRAAAASPVHIHGNDDETLLLLGGRMVVWRGDTRHELGPGDAIFLPRRIPHCYRVIEDADVITVCTPSGIEAFFAAAGWDMAQGDPPADWDVDPDTLRKATFLTDETVLGPPLAADAEMPRTVGI